MKGIFTFFMMVFVCGSLFAAEIWETREEIDVNGMIAEKSVMVSGSVMKVVNASPNGATEDFYDLDADKVTMINHKYKTFQTIKLSELVKFSQQWFNAMSEQKGNVDPEKLLPKVEFEKQGNETVEKWNCEVWTVSVDGRPYSKVWVAPEAKNNQLIEFKKKFAKVLPESLSKYRSVDSKIEDKFVETGMIVRSLKLSRNPKMSDVRTTLKKIGKSDLKKIELVIPSDYVDKSAPETKIQK